MRIIAAQRHAIGVAPACEALGVARATFYRQGTPKTVVEQPRHTPRTLSDKERADVLAVLHEQRFMDLPPAQVYAALLDEARYLCSISTMYRILQAHQEVKERRNQRRHPTYQAPELLATGPNQLWSWDITKLRGPAKWTYYYLYVILDVFSRYVVGWMVAHREAAALAERLIAQSCERQQIVPGHLTLHADRGSSMKSKPVAMLLADLGVTKTHSRPHVSNDNPYSESQFKTLKYRPDFPDRFGSIQDSRSFFGPFFHWYNHEHHHSALGLLTPFDVHDGHAGTRIEARSLVLEHAFKATPERFVKGMPKPLPLPHEVWINPPRKEVKSDDSPVA